ncbi:MAG: hypothetical protein LC785_11700 [Acidobacteria bacterium]|nr:hypothetical protein [Acidobacteriota bacterium]MCA1642590.1 hypothetical protein [Acidobacteriota bacterium]
MKRLVPTIIILVAFGFSACGLFKPKMGNIVETWQAENQNLKLRIVMRQERCFAVCGAYYTFLSAPVGSDSWREIFTAHHDDPNPIPRENLRFVNPQIGYVFFGSKYAVTTDAGKSWMVWDAWDANKSMQFEKYKLYPAVVDVSVESDGRGRMRLYSITDKATNKPELQTADYGRSWQLK